MQTNQWFRIDKGDGAIAECNSVNVVRAARGAYDNVAEVIQAGRFQTTFAIYSQAQHLTEQERQLRQGAINDRRTEERLRQEGVIGGPYEMDTCAHCGSDNLGAFVCNACGASNLDAVRR